MCRDPYSWFTIGGSSFFGSHPIGGDGGGDISHCFSRSGTARVSIVVKEVANIVCPRNLRAAMR